MCPDESPGRVGLCNILIKMKKKDMSKNKNHHENADEQEVAAKDEMIGKAAGEQETESPEKETEAEAENDEVEELKKSKSELETKLTAASDKLAKTEDAYVRLMAEFDTFRRRTAQEKLDMVATAAEETIKGLLVVLDDCERAMKLLADSDDSAAAKEGTELIYGKLMAYLKSKGLTPIDAMGADFDTDEHEAVAQFPVEEEGRKGKVFDVVQTGYKLNGKVIRFAKVIVGI